MILKIGVLPLAPLSFEYLFWIEEFSEVDASDVRCEPTSWIRFQRSYPVVGSDQLINFLSSELISHASSGY